MGEKNNTNTLQFSDIIVNYDSIFINQLGVNNKEDNIDFAKMNAEVFNRKIYLFTEEQYLDACSHIFSENKKIGDSVPIQVTAKDLLDRFTKEEERMPVWERLKAFTGWTSEKNSTTVRYPIFKHKKA